MNWYKRVKLADNFFADPPLRGDYSTYMDTGHNDLWAVERQSVWAVLGYPKDLYTYTLQVEEDDMDKIHSDYWGDLNQKRTNIDYVSKGRYEKLPDDQYGTISAAFSADFFRMTFKEQDIGRRKVAELLFGEFGKNLRMYEYGKH